MKNEIEKIRVKLLVLLLFVIGCNSENSTKISVTQPIVQLNNLETGAVLQNAGVGVVIADMNGDGYLDIVSACPNGIKYFESDSNGTYFDRGVLIDDIGAPLNDAGIGIAVADLDGNNIPDIVVGSPNSIMIFKNPILQKK